jgi:hypothetical protein
MDGGGKETINEMITKNLSETNTLAYHTVTMVYGFILISQSNLEACHRYFVSCSCPFIFFVSPIS